MASPFKYRNWKLDTDENRIAWLQFDKADASANVLSKDVLDELNSCLEELKANRPKGLVIISGKKNGFIAGADVKEFVSLGNKGDALKHIKRGQMVFNKLEALPFPTVAAIHGFCLGGGLELALACRQRITTDDPSTKLGLPEVRLGIHPGFGGTVRMTQLLSGITGLDLMLTGRAISSKAAKKIGLVDSIVPLRHLKTAATQAVNRPLKRKSSFNWQKLGDMKVLKPYVANFIRKKTKAKASPDHYPAPFALIDLWEKFSGNPSKMMGEEALSVAKLVMDSTAQNLVRLFLLQDRLKSIGKGKKFDIGHIHVIGAGIMGGDIAAWSALRGFKVTLQDREAKFISPAIKRAGEFFRKRLKEERLVQAAMDNLIPDLRGEGLKKADIVLEAVFEDAAVKRALFKNLEKKIKPGAIIATNTSSIPIEEIAKDLSNPEKLVGIHFFNPVAKMLLVEVVRGEATSGDAFDMATYYVGKIGKLPLPVKSLPGFLVNRVLMPYLLEGVIMESEGVPPHVVDKAATDFGMPMGPLLLADTVGLDICHHVVKVFSETMDIEIPQRLASMVKAGKLGKKSGEGFYRYEKGKQVKTKNSAYGPGAGDVADRLIFRYLNESVACLREGVVEDGDLLDAGMVFGTGFSPFLGGPMNFIAKTGYKEMHKRIKELEKTHGARFKADAGWKNLKGNGS